MKIRGRDASERVVGFVSLARGDGWFTPHSALTPESSLSLSVKYVCDDETLRSFVRREVLDYTPVNARRVVRQFEEAFASELREDSDHRLETMNKA